MPRTPHQCSSDLTTPHKLRWAAQLPFRQTLEKPHRGIPLDIHQTPLPRHMMPPRKRKSESKFLSLRKSASSHPRSSDLAEKACKKGLPTWAHLRRTSRNRQEECQAQPNAFQHQNEEPLGPAKDDVSKGKAASLLSEGLLKKNIYELHVSGRGENMQ